jgi:hypothetical protein
MLPLPFKSGVLLWLGLSWQNMEDFWGWALRYLWLLHSWNIPWWIPATLRQIERSHEDAPQCLVNSLKLSSQLAADNWLPAIGWVVWTFLDNWASSWLQSQPIQYWSERTALLSSANYHQVINDSTRLVWELNICKKKTAFFFFWSKLRVTRKLQRWAFLNIPWTQSMLIITLILTWPICHN